MVLKCDLDTALQTIYKAYSKRWEIEIVMRFYKSALEFDETKLLEDLPYRKIMRILARARMFNDPGIGWRLIKINPSQEVLKKLDIHATEKKRGFPPKVKPV
mgnify:CR=1 FL=1